MPSAIKPTDFKGSEVALQLPPASLVKPTGLMAPAVMQSHYSQADRSVMARLAQQVLKDPLLRQRLCDRIFELLQDDLRLQRDRDCQSGSRRY